MGNQSKENLNIVIAEAGKINKEKHLSDAISAAKVRIDCIYKNTSSIRYAVDIDSNLYNFDDEISAQLKQLILSNNIISKAVNKDTKLVQGDVDLEKAKAVYTRAVDNVINNLDIVTSSLMNFTIQSGYGYFNSGIKIAGLNSVGKGKLRKLNWTTEVVDELQLKEADKFDRIQYEYTVSHQHNDSKQPKSLPIFNLNEKEVKPLRISYLPEESRAPLTRNIYYVLNPDTLPLCVDNYKLLVKALELDTLGYVYNPIISLSLDSIRENPSSIKVIKTASGEQLLTGALRAQEEVELAVRLYARSITFGKRLVRVNNRKYADRILIQRVLAYGDIAHSLIAARYVDNIVDLKFLSEVYEKLFQKDKLPRLEMNSVTGEVTPESYKKIILEGQIMLNMSDRKYNVLNTIAAKIKEAVYTNDNAQAIIDNIMNAQWIDDVSIVNNSKTGKPSLKVQWKDEIKGKR